MDWWWLWLASSGEQNSNSVGPAANLVLTKFYIRMKWNLWKVNNEKQSEVIVTTCSFTLHLESFRKFVSMAQSLSATRHFSKHNNEHSKTKNTATQLKPKLNCFVRVCVFAQLTYTYAYELTHIVNLIGLQLTILWYNYTYNANYRNFWEIEAHLHMFYYYHYHYCGGRAYNRRGSRCAHQTKPNKTSPNWTLHRTQHNISETDSQREPTAHENRANHFRGWKRTFEMV